MRVMSSVLTCSFVLSLAASVFAAPAQAEVFVWQDEHTKVSWTFPDRWAKGNNQKPDDAATILAPGADQASCRLRTREDRRFVIYPRHLDGSVQRLNVSRDFWADYAGQYDNTQLHSVTDNTGLGLAFASMADMSFYAGGTVKRGLMSAGIYNDTAYIFECSAEASAYEKWHPIFQSVLHSVEMRPIREQNTNGYYRNFVDDRTLLIHNSRPEDLYVF